MFATQLAFLVDTSFCIKSNPCQVCEEEAVQIEVFCLAVNCVDRSPLQQSYHPYLFQSSISISICCLFPYSLASRFLALVPLKLSQLQLLASACLMVAWKVKIVIIVLLCVFYVMSPKPNQDQHYHRMHLISILFNRCAKIGRFGWRQSLNIPTTISRQMNSW